MVEIALFHQPRKWPLLNRLLAKKTRNADLCLHSIPDLPPRAPPLTYDIIKHRSII
ncbi:hypothetical protein KL86PLE_30332 [uncultured Pleomorphomonas sp.]|uniref:Uncharacterized protein n=1 Tax=uncultured Pleomorphomonas sp. TaxID=442121 RepID=A0A212LEC6_9HYPH|nr:hypothetical protein KL86PLE_30332 [uncultured Pleomorphomonas sp.]